MNRFKTRVTSCFDYLHEDDLLGSYQDLYDMLADDYRHGRTGNRKSKLLLYIQHRAQREHNVVIHTGAGAFPVGFDTHHGDPADIADLCEQYDGYEAEIVREFLSGIPN